MIKPRRASWDEEHAQYHIDYWWDARHKRWCVALYRYEGNGLWEQILFDDARWREVGLDDITKPEEADQMVAALIRAYPNSEICNTQPYEEA